MKDEEEELVNQDKDTESPPINDTILEAFFEFYVPAMADDPEADRRTTNDIMEEMENIDSVPRWAITNSLLEHGFKIDYTETGPYWLLKQRS